MCPTNSSFAVLRVVAIVATNIGDRRTFCLPSGVGLHRVQHSLGCRRYVIVAVSLFYSSASVLLESTFVNITQVGIGNAFVKAGSYHC